MNVQVKSSNGITLVPMESKLLAERQIFIEGQINTELACEFVKKILLLNNEDKYKPIKVFINSEGGTVNDGWLIYDTIQSSKAPIQMFCMGKAYSMAAILFSSGNNGRYMLENSQLMLHEPLIENSVAGNSSSIRSISESLIKIKNKITQILSKHTRKTEEEIEKIISTDNYFNSHESVELGLCDEIITFDKILEV